MNAYANVSTSLLCNCNRLQPAVSDKLARDGTHRSIQMAGLLGLEWSDSLEQPGKAKMNVSWNLEMPNAGVS